MESVGEVLTMAVELMPELNTPEPAAAPLQVCLDDVLRTLNLIVVWCPQMHRRHFQDIAPEEGNRCT